MAVAAATLITPIGPLTTTLYPGESLIDLTVRATQYLANAIADPAIAAATGTLKDQLTIAFALAQAFEDIYIRMSAEPLQVIVSEKGTTGYSNEQIRNMKAISERYRAQYLALIPAAVEPIRNMMPGTLSVPTEVCW